MGLMETNLKERSTIDVATAPHVLVRDARTWNVKCGVCWMEFWMAGSDVDGPCPGSTVGEVAR